MRGGMREGGGWGVPRSGDRRNRGLAPPAGDSWDSHASEAWHTGVVSGRSIGVDEFDTHGGTFFVWPTHLDWPVTIKSVLNRIARPI